MTDDREHDDFSAAWADVKPDENATSQTEFDDAFREPAPVVQIPIGDGPLGLQGEAYHADRVRDSNSVLKLFRASPQLYHRHKQGLPSKEPTAAMELGTVLHTAILEPEKFQRTYMVEQEKLDKRFKENKAKAAAFDAEVKARGCKVLDLSSWNKIGSMVAGIQDNDEAMALLESQRHQHHPEYSVQWVDSETGLPLKAMADNLMLLIDDNRHGVIIDVKSSARPTPFLFARSAIDLGYHDAAALYMDGFFQALKLESLDFQWIVSNTADPHECFVCRPSKPMIALGRHNNRTTLRAIRHRMETGNWRSHYSQRVYDIDVPGYHWQHRQNEARLNDPDISDEELYMQNESMKRSEA